MSRDPQVFEQKFGSSITSVLEKSQKPDEKPMSFAEYLENKKNIFEVDEKGLVYLQQAGWGAHAARSTVSTYFSEDLQ